MVTSCLFGILVFGSDYTLIYRFLTDDFFTYLYKSFLEPKYGLSGEHKEEPGEVAFSIDDTIVQHFSTLLQFFDQTCNRKSPIKRITLQSNMQVFFDQIGKNKLLCMVDQSFNTLIVLKTINLFKSLIKFHLGALAFEKSPIVNKTIDRISASLQYYLNNIMTNQSLIFESTEYLHINFLIRQQCIDACSIINQNIQLSSTTIVITCKDKIVHLQSSNEQNRLSNSDIFLLILNNTSRSLRVQFQSQDIYSLNPIAHIYKTKNDIIIAESFTSSVTDLTEDVEQTETRRTQSLPTNLLGQSTEILDTSNSDIIFMKTSNKTLAPFTMYTIPLTNVISVIILLEWKTSLACSSLSELISQLNLCMNQLQFTYKKLSNQIRTVENNTIIRKLLDIERLPYNTLTSLLSEIYSIHKSLPKGNDVIDDENQKGEQMLRNLKRINDFAMDIFYKLYFSSDNNTLIKDNNQLQTNIIHTLKIKLLGQLRDWFSFIETKSQGNITISYCQHDFPGLVHFVLIVRSRGRIYTPVLFTDEYKNYLINRNINETEHIKEKKIIAFELDCLSALQRGCTSYTMTDEYFTYNYTIRLQESNGASMRLYKPFNKSEPPGILHYDFYEKVAYENYASLGEQTPIACFELVCVHLRFVPANVVRDHCDLLWHKLLELDE